MFCVLHVGLSNMESASLIVDSSLFIAPRGQPVEATSAVSCYPAGCSHSLVSDVVSVFKAFQPTSAGVERMFVLVAQRRSDEVPRTYER